MKNIKEELKEYYTNKFKHCKSIDEFIEAVDEENKPLQEVIDTDIGDVEGAKSVIKSTKALSYWNGNNYNTWKWIKHHEINIIDLEFNDIKSISTVERHYGEFNIKVKLDDNRWYDVMDKTPYGEKTTLFSESTAERLVEKYGKPNQKLGYTFIHDPSLWEEPLEEDLW